MVQTATALGFIPSFEFSPTKKISEDELVGNLKRGCNTTFTYLYKNYCGTLYGVVLDFIDDKDLAKDVLQEVFVNIYRKINTYDETKSRLFTWMVTVTRHLCIDTLRSKSYRKFSSTDEITESTGALVISLNPQIDTIGIHKMLDKIKPTHRKLIELSYYKGYSNVEIAQMLQIPLGTVKTRIKRALVQLRENM